MNTQDTIFDAAAPVNDDYAEMIANLNAARAAAGTGTTMADLAYAANLMRNKVHTQVRDYNIGRNDRCPCGSGKKYKNCCLSSGRYETTHNAK